MTFNYRFDFGLGAAEDGYTKVTAHAVMKMIGYGFSSTDKVNAKDRGGNQPLRRDFCIPQNSCFLVDVPDGTYSVSILLGDELADTETTVKAGEGRMMVNKQRTVPGHFVWVRFAVWVTDGRLKLIFSGLAPRINAMEITAAPQTCTLFLAGDSTVRMSLLMATHTGWGQMLPQYLKADAAVANYALSGRSSQELY